MMVQTSPWRDHRVASTRAATRTSWYARYRAAVGLLDGVVILSALVVVFQWRFGRDSEMPVVGTEYPYGVVALVVAVLWWGSLEANGTRERSIVGHGLEEYRRVLVASVHAFAAVAILSYFLQAQLSRAFFLVLLPTGITLLLAGRWGARQVLHALRRQGRAVTPTLVVGSPQEVGETVRELRRNGNAGFRAVAVAFPDADACAAEFPCPALSGLPVMDSAFVGEFTATHQVEAVVVTQGLAGASLRSLAWSLEKQPVALMFVPSLTDVAGPRLSVQQLQDLSLVAVELPHYSGWNHLLKRLFDVCFSATVLVVLSPVLLAIGALIKGEDGGPVIFRQVRVGLGGEPFVIHKFRSMRVDAEERLAALLTDSDADGPLFKMERDPRITRVGRVLRKFSLDELPQFWTVLRGDMSVVGPRPHLAHELANYPDEGMRRPLIKPGITGLWQVSGRSDLSFDEAVRLDLRYVENWSLSGDLTIILRTVRTVVHPSGAY